MAEEIKNEGSQEPNYLEQALEANKALKEQLQASREEMARMANDNKAIMKQLLEGGSIETKAEDTRSIEEIVKEMQTNDNLNDIEYAELSLLYREKCMNRKKNPFDPFVGSGHEYQPDEREAEKAQHLADCLQQCIDYANGDNRAFINELDRITVDIPGGKFFNRR